MSKKLFSIGMLMVTFLFVSCSTKTKPEETKPEEAYDFNISGVYIPPEINTYIGGEITFAGKGFKTDDRIKLVLMTNADNTYVAGVTVVGLSDVTFVTPEGVETGKYRIMLVRGDKTLTLGFSNFNIGINTYIPDIAGMTVKGMVYSGDKGIPGVVVSDGYFVTTTNQNGIYYLASEKKHGFVFISVPANYEVNSNQNAPQFFQRVNANVVEQRDFSLTPVNNEKHVVLGIADLHLANRNNDLEQFGKFLIDANTVIGNYQAGGTKVYGIMLGDMTWDLYWYDNRFALREYVTWMNRINCPVFNSMGNHDNDGYCVGDWLGEQAFKNVIGPTYYSFNLGKVHYIVLDDIEWINTGGSQGTIGSRNYNGVVVADQMEWLKKDLATITDKSAPLVIALHIQLYGRPDVNNSVSFHLTRGQELVNCLAGFSNVHFLSGHYHNNYRVVASNSLMEHNIGAVCATWWWTGRNGYAGNHICADGSVGGYGVFEFDSKDVSWYYKSIGYDRHYQFRSYDRNRIHITAEKYAPNANATYAAKLSGFAGEYATSSTNDDVLINVWGYDPQWNIEVREGGAPLNVTRISALDPLHIISYEALRLNVNVDPTSSFVTSATSHIFKVTASSPNSTLEIKVTDRFGNVYTENMTRPKELTCGMK